MRKGNVIAVLMSLSVTLLTQTISDPSLQQTMTALKAEEKINPTLRGPGNSTLSQLLLDALELQDEQ